MSICGRRSKTRSVDDCYHFGPSGATCHQLLHRAQKFHLRRGGRQFRHLPYQSLRGEECLQLFGRLKLIGAGRTWLRLGPELVSPGRYWSHVGGGRLHGRRDVVYAQHAWNLTFVVKQPWV